MKKQALVTGGAGFLGRHFAAELVQRGYDVLTIDLKYQPVESLKLDWIHLKLDLFQFLTQMGNNSRFDLVVHCAARDPHRAAIDAMNMNFAYNVALDTRMFEWAVRTKQKRVLYISSSAVYPIELQTENHNGWALREDDVTFDDDIVKVPDKLYGWTKYVGELSARMAMGNGLPVHVVRPFSGYGEDQSENFPFRAIVERARRRENPFTVWGSADQTRDWIHVSDVVNGALAVVNAESYVPTNLCTGQGTSIGSLADICVLMSGYEAEMFVDTTKPLGVMHRVGDPARLNKHYVPKVTIEEGVSRALRGDER